ncbi:MAG TPA: hypothetical protein VGC79_30955 [Polyangiaceae bacterium]
MSVSSPAPATQAVVRRAPWLRLFALLIVLLGVAAQQRVLTPAMRPSASVVRLVAERVQSIETQALRAEPALRVAVAPIFARVPRLSEPNLAWPRRALHTCLAPPLAHRSCASISHFHSKRRIPRMNSEEPPRA